MEAVNIPQERIDRMCMAFLVDRVGIGHEAAARLIHTDLRGLDDVLEEKGSADARGRSSLDGLAAIQSLLLSAYSPETAVRWMKEANEDLDHATPSYVLSSGVPDAIGRVLGATYRRIAR